ncbi:Exosome complex exonuclease rrp6 [Golovinomyces cichoracearum]|uniref:Exosome complex exonuclease rrp6 n=1 Tax=Golovinomyces cichoracearum TaxID=62708 RepID=A0A420HQ38_9PEZI|nr:Exosome complex exonuclease rrp6 [Golovinomyces cichoracearum]
MDGSLQFQTLQKELQPSLLDITRSVVRITAEDLTFQRSLDRKVRTALDEQSGRLLTLANSLLKSAASVSDLRTPTLEDVEDVENNWRSVIDVVDSLLEKSDSCLDEYTGVIKRNTTAESATQAEVPRSKFKKQGSTLDHRLRTQNIVKPQLAFEKKSDNHDNSPWKPLLIKKPHAIIPLEASLELFENDYGQMQYRHPYYTEIRQSTFPDFVYKKADPIPYTPIESTSAIYVDTEAQMMEMLEELKNSSEIAVDLEHHDARSYTGLLSLMQISTRSKDWIVDTLKPWRHKLQVLNEVFANPRIIKVFHGAFMDIIWLQRDLGLYVTCLFDTYRACQTLGYPGGSLAFLLKKFVNFDADKIYQMADWRIRPLPEKMLFYARADTHFLLYIYDHMRNELLEKSNLNVPEKNLLEIVLEKSKETSLSRYENQIYNAESGKGPGGWFSLLLKMPSMFNKEQFAVFRAVHAWRDKIARTDDENPTFLMPNHILSSISKIMPTDVLSLLRIANPTSHSVKSRVEELLEVICSSKMTGSSGPSITDVLRPNSMSTSQSKVSLLPQEKHQKNIINIPDEGELRSTDSSFWGGAFGSSMWDIPNKNSNDDLKLSFLLPTLQPELSTQVQILDDSLPNELSHQSQEIMKKPEEEPFVLKRGIKRKNDAADRI